MAPPAPYVMGLGRKDAVSEPRLEPWQRALRAGDCFVAATREGEAQAFAWVIVLDAAEGAALLRGRRYSRDAPRGVEEVVPRAAALFPLTEAQFLAARRAGWPRRLRAVQALAGLVAGGSA